MRFGEKIAHPAALIMLIWVGASVRAADMGTGFTYQGRLEKPSGTPVDGPCGFRFGLWTDATSTLPADQIGSDQVLPVDVQDGIFTAVIDFFTQPTDGTARWLQVEVQCAGDPGFQVLTPRVLLRPVPHALALPGLYTQQTVAAANIIAGHSDNVVLSGVVGATIGGGGGEGLFAAHHQVSNDYGTIGGGLANSTGDFTSSPGEHPFATVAGGESNTATAQGSTVGGGIGNWAAGVASTVPGGLDNRAGGFSSFAAGFSAIVRDAATVGGGDTDGDEGTFVWGDRSEISIFQSTGPNQFLIRSAGGMGINTNAPTDPLTVNGVIRSMTGGFEFPDGSTQTSAASQGVPLDLRRIATLRWDLVNATYPLGESPRKVAFDGTSIWVANGNTSGQLTKIRAVDGTILGNYPVGLGPFGVEFDGENVWVTKISESNVTKVRAADGAILGTYGPFNAPQGLAFDGENIWVTSSGSPGSLSKLRASDGANLGSFTVGSGPVALAFDGENIWAANSVSDDVTKLRASDGANLGTFPVGSVPLGIAFDGTHIWVANDGSDTVTKLYPANGDVVGTFPAGSGPGDIAFDGANIWVSNISGVGVTKLRASDGTILGTYPVGLAPSGIVFDGANIWVTSSGDDTISRIYVADDVGPNSQWQNVGSGISYSSGNVGVGTATPANTLDIEGGVAIGAAFSGSNAAPANGLIVEGNVGMGTTAPMNKLDVEGRMAIGTGFSGTSTAPADGLIVEGSIGLGTAAPVNKLDVEGRVAIGAGYSGTNSAPTNGLIVEGNVGVATASPLERLHVNAPGGGGVHLSSNNVGDLRISFNNGGGTHYIFDDQSDSNSLAVETGLGNDFVINTDGANNRLRITSAGLIGMARTPTTNRLEVEGNASKTTSGGWLANSDACIKEDVRTITDALMVINRLRPVAFRYTEEYKSQHPYVEDQDYYNFIAQEFAEVFPEAVSEDGSGILQMDSHPASIYAVAAIQELNAIVKEKDFEIQKLAEANAALAKSNAELEARLARIEQLLLESSNNGGK